MTIGRVSATLVSLRGLRSLRHRNYRLFFFGQLVSVAGSRMQVIAQSWLVLILTGDPFLLGVVGAAQHGPLLLGGLFGGLIADALPKHRTIVVAQVLEMLLALALFALTASGVIEVWHILVLAVALGVVTAVEVPTRQAFAIEMVGREDVANAVALNVSTFNTARVIGPAIAGFVIAVSDVSVVFLINSLSYLVVVIALLVMRTEALLGPNPIPHQNGIRTALGDLVDGLNYVRHAPLVRLTLVTLGVVSIFGINLQVLGPFLARDVLQADASGYGLLMSAFGAGALAAAVGITVLGTRPVMIPIGAMLLGASLVVLAGSRFLPLSLGLLVLGGIGAIGMGATGNVTLQLQAPDRLRGRVMSVYVVVFDGTAPIGGLMMGAIASQAGVPVALAIGGGVSAGMGLLAAIWLRGISLRRSSP